MPSKLIDLKTNLKLLKYGHDRPGGGSSDQPYIQSDIPDPIDEIAPPTDDTFIRGGVKGANEASATDAKRISRFFKDKPKGTLFLAKQVALQFSNPKLETKRGVGSFFTNLLLGDIGLVEPTRLYNLGLNTLAQVRVNAFGIHFNRHGLLPIQDDSTKYLSIAQYNNRDSGDDGASLPQGSRNRLIRYAHNLLPDPPPSNTRARNIFRNIAKFIPGVSSFFSPGPERIINSYFGGPGSVYGVGKTFIRRFDYTTNGINKQPAQAKGVINYGELLGVSKQYVSFPSSTQNFVAPISVNPNNPNYNPFNPSPIQLAVLSQQSATIKPNTITTLDGLGLPLLNLGMSKPSYLDLATYSTTNIIPVSITSLPSQGGGSAAKPQNITPVNVVGITPVKNANYQTYQSIINSKKLKEKSYTLTSGSTKIDLNAVGIYGDIEKDHQPFNILPTSLDYPAYYNGNDQETIKLNLPWNKINREIRVGSGRQDIINLLNLLPTTGNLKGAFANDLVNFRIASMGAGGSIMVFRAFLTQYSDNTDADWNSIKYAGRGESFYIYNGFSRKIQIGFKAAALSREEMDPMYNRLNYLMGNVMPDYNGNGLMEGPMVKMTVGNWIKDQYGILNSVSYTIPNDSPWEIGLSVNDGTAPLVLPHIVEVSLTFTPIGSKGGTISKRSVSTRNIAY